MVEVQMKNHKNIFVCFLAALQRRSGDQLVPLLIFQRIIHLMNALLKQKYFGTSDALGKHITE